MMRTVPLAFVAVSIGAAVALAQPADRSRPSGVGYPTVAAALEAMRAKRGVNVSIQSGWTIIEDRANLTLWSFTPAGHPAYPAVVRRVMTQKDGAWFVTMGVLCEAAKSACDKLVLEFRELNKKMREDIERSRSR